MLLIHIDHKEGNAEATTVYKAATMKQAKDTLYYSITKFLNEERTPYNLEPNYVRMILEAMNPADSPTPLKLIHPTITRNIYARAANIQGGIYLCNTWIRKESPYEYLLSLDDYGHHHTGFYIDKRGGADADNRTLTKGEIIYSRTIKANNQNHVIFSDHTYPSGYKTIEEAQKRQAYRRKLGYFFMGDWYIKQCKDHTEYQIYFEGEPTP